MDKRAKGRMNERGRGGYAVPFVAKNESRRAFFNVPRFIARSALAKRLHPQTADSHEMCIKGAHPSPAPPVFRSLAFPRLVKPRMSHSLRGKMWILINGMEVPAEDRWSSSPVRHVPSV